MVVVDKLVMMVESEDMLVRRVESENTGVKWVQTVRVGDDGGGPDVVDRCDMRQKRGST